MQCAQMEGTKVSSKRGVRCSQSRGKSNVGHSEGRKEGKLASIRSLLRKKIGIITYRNRDIAIQSDLIALWQLPQRKHECRGSRLVWWLAQISGELNHVSCNLSGCASTENKLEHEFRSVHPIVEQDDHTCAA